MRSFNHKYDQGFGNLHVLSVNGFLHQPVSYLAHCEHPMLQRQRWGIIPPNQAVSVQRRDVLESSLVYLSSRIYDGFTTSHFPLQIINMRKAVVLAWAWEIVVRFLQYMKNIYIYKKIGGTLA